MGPLDTVEGLNPTPLVPARRRAPWRSAPRCPRFGVQYSPWRDAWLTYRAGRPLRDDAGRVRLFVSRGAAADALRLVWLQTGGT